MWGGVHSREREWEREGERGGVKSLFVQKIGKQPTNDLYHISFLYYFCES